MATCFHESPSLAYDTGAMDLAPKGNFSQKHKDLLIDEPAMVLLNDKKAMGVMKSYKSETALSTWWM